IPLMVHAAVHRSIGKREADCAALLVAVFSFNTVYASTQISDSLCTFLFVAAVALLLRGRERSRHLGTSRKGPFEGLWYVAAGGLAAGVAAQVRPNLLLLPLWLAGASLLFLRPRLPLRYIAVFIATAYAVLVPWTV